MKNEFQSLLSEKNLRELPNILLVSAECAPLSKTGGLADVVGALPKYLQKLGVDARVITPYHRCIKDKYASEVEHLFTFYVDLGWRRQYAGCMQEKLKYLLSIHNIAFQGRYDFGYVQDLLHVDPKYYTSEIMELWGIADFLKAGCYFADKISTVSPTYAEEIKTDYYSEGLGAILNARASDLCGILNGIDAVVFNPEKDALIPAHFSAEDRSGKAACKSALQERLGLEVRSDLPILAMVTRMTEQKGFELVMEKLEDIMENETLQFVLLGSGDSRYEDYMRYMEERYKGRLVSYIGYNEELAHQIYAGSDFFLMPSRFEPCGLSQMISMRYGCLPIVRETGGLKDTVIPLNTLTKEGTGFTFADFDAGEMRAAVHEAIACFDNPEVMDELIHNAMTVDFSFERSAEEYVRLYISMLDPIPDQNEKPAEAAQNPVTEDDSPEEAVPPEESEDKVTDTISIKEEA